MGQTVAVGAVSEFLARQNGLRTANGHGCGVVGGVIGYLGAGWDAQVFERVQSWIGERFLDVDVASLVALQDIGETRSSVAWNGDEIVAQINLLRPERGAGQQKRSDGAQ